MLFVRHCVAGFLLLFLPAVVQAQFTFTTNADGSLNVSAYTGPGGDVIIPDVTNGLAVTTISGNAFGPPVTSIAIPYSVISIGQVPFQEDSTLTNITVDPANPSYSSLNGVLFDETHGTLIAYPPGLANDMYDIPDSVTNIAVAAFSFCKYLTGVNIPDSVTTIGNAAFFVSGLTSATIPGSLSTAGYETFAQCANLTTVTIQSGVTSIGNEAFESSTKLSSISIPGTVTSIGPSAFETCSSLASITFPNGVVSIGSGAMVGCTKLASVTLPASVSNIGIDAFAFCPSLTSAYFEGNAPPDSGNAFNHDSAATVYYLPGTTGWGLTFGGAPTAVWYLPSPTVLSFEPSFGVQSQQFSFPISWATNGSVIVQVSTNFTNPAWISVSTNVLSNGTNYFSDPSWTNYSGRIYRVIAAP